MFGGQKKTFKPKNKIKRGTKRYDLHKQAKATLGAGDLSKAVKLPAGENKLEWLAANTIDFFNQINLLYGAVSDFCTPESCPTMSAGPDAEYFWQGGKDYPKATSVPAPKYVELLMSWIQSSLDDPKVFPVELDPANPPKSFEPAVKKIFKRLFRVYAHIYLNHFDKVTHLGIEAHLNTGFKHFYLFTREFGLIEDKKELRPLQAIIDKICAEYKLKP